MPARMLIYDPKLPGKIVSVTVISTVNIRTSNLAGKTVGDVRTMVEQLMNVGPRAIPIVNGGVVDSRHVLNDGDVLEFAIPGGTKGYPSSPIVTTEHDFTAELEEQLKQAEADVRAGRVLGPFDNARDALRALEAHANERAHAGPHRRKIRRSAR